jgi:hypothetical protein
VVLTNNAIGAFTNPVQFLKFRYKATPSQLKKGISYDREICSEVIGFVCFTASDSELTSETMNPFRHFGRTPWTAD